MTGHAIARPRRSGGQRGLEGDDSAASASGIAAVPGGTARRSKPADGQPGVGEPGPRKSAGGMSAGGKSAGGMSADADSAQTKPAQTQPAATAPEDRKPASAPPDLRLLLPPRALGGHEAALIGWLQDAAAAGLRAEIVAPDAALQRALAAAGLPAIGPVPALRGGAGLAVPALLRALLAAPRGRPLLLAPGCLHAAAWLLVAAVLLRHRVWVYVPMTHSARAMGFRGAAWRDALLRPWLQGVHAWVTPSVQQAQQLRSVWGVTAAVHVLPNVARLPADVARDVLSDALRDVPRAAPAHVPASTPARVAPHRPARQAAGDRLRVAWVGRFDLHQKGLDWLADVLRAEAWFGRHCQWRFQGPGSGAARLQSLAARLGSDVMQVHPAGPVDDALRGCDVLLLASRFEGLPLVALEATARGRAVVATRASGLAGALHEDCLYDFGDAPGLQRALQRMASPATRRDAVAHAQAHLGPNALQARYRQALDALCLALRSAAHPQTRAQTQTETEIKVEAETKTDKETQTQTKATPQTHAQRGRAL